MLVACDSCGTKRDFSIFEQDVKCPACGASGEALSPVTEDADANASAVPYTVLIAEDDGAMRETYRVWFANNPGWILRFAENGKEALAELDSAVDVLVLDRKMPEVSGPEVVNRLHETSFDGEVIVVSAYEQDDHLSEADVVGYITKPIHEETLFDMLEQIVR